jgi:hypothetical protein
VEAPFWALWVLTPIGLELISNNMPYDIILNLQFQCSTWGLFVVVAFCFVLFFSTWVFSKLYWWYICISFFLTWKIQVYNTNKISSLYCVNTHRHTHTHTHSCKHCPQFNERSYIGLGVCVCVCVCVCFSDFCS